MMNSDELRKFALMGARARIEALRQEVDKIRAAFPELGSKPAAPKVIYAAKSAPRRTSAAKGKRRSHTDEFRARMVKMVMAGGSAYAVGRTHGVHPGLLLKWVHKARGSAKAGKRREQRKHSDEFKAKLVAEVAGGKTIRAVAKAHDVADQVLRRWIEAAKAASK